MILRDPIPQIITVGLPAEQQATLSGLDAAIWDDHENYAFAAANLAGELHGPLTEAQVTASNHIVEVLEATGLQSLVFDDDTEQKLLLIEGTDQADSAGAEQFNKIAAYAGMVVPDFLVIELPAAPEMAA